ncbi:MAG: hypothetical protein KY442_12420 [Proteobacteria bacterium]|nr:hypothetical protein [Pseudomonadota bacterium]
MNAPVSGTPSAFAQTLHERALQRLGKVSAQIADALAAPSTVGRVSKVATVSDFAIDTLVRQPQLLPRLLADDGRMPQPAPELRADNRDEWAMLLRRYRSAESTRLIWRDACGLDDVDATLAGSTRLAETCLQVALAALEGEFLQRHGVVRDSDDQPQQLVVFGLGKLGGEELNFSSDVDLVYGYERSGDAAGEQAIAGTRAGGHEVNVTAAPPGCSAPRRNMKNGIPERGGVVNPFSQRFSGPGRLLLGSVERGWGQHAAPAAKRGRTVLRPPEGGAHCPGADSRRHQAGGVGVKLWSASLSMSRSTTARGCQAFLRDDVAA